MNVKVTSQVFWKFLGSVGKVCKILIAFARDLARMLLYYLVSAGNLLPLLTLLLCVSQPFICVRKPFLLVKYISQCIWNEKKWEGKKIEKRDGGPVDEASSGQAASHDLSYGDWLLSTDHSRSIPSIDSNINFCILRFSVHKNFYSRENYFFEYLKKKNLFFSVRLYQIFLDYTHSRGKYLKKFVF